MERKETAAAATANGGTEGWPWAQGLCFRTWLRVNERGLPRPQRPFHFGLGGECGHQRSSFGRGRPKPPPSSPLRAPDSRNQRQNRPPAPLGRPRLARFPPPPAAAAPPRAGPGTTEQGTGAAVGQRARAPAVAAAGCRSCRNRRPDRRAPPSGAPPSGNALAPDHATAPPTSRSRPPAGTCGPLSRRPARPARRPWRCTRAAAAATAPTDSSKRRLTAAPRRRTKCAGAGGRARRADPTGQGGAHGPPAAARPHFG